MSSPIKRTKLMQHMLPRICKRQRFSSSDWTSPFLHQTDTSCVSLRAHLDNWGQVTAMYADIFGPKWQKTVCMFRKSLVFCLYKTVISHFLESNSIKRPSLMIAPSLWWMHWPLHRHQSMHINMPGVCAVSSIRKTGNAGLLKRAFMLNWTWIW